MEAIILAGGPGTRLGELTKNTPKPMVAVGGRPFLAHLMSYWKEQGVKHFILSVGYRHEVVINYFGDDYLGVPLSYSVEKDLLGTGGGLFFSVKQLKQKKTFLVLNGDTFFGISLQVLNKKHRMANAKVSLALFEVSDRNRYEGVQLNEQFEITSFVSREQELRCSCANGGVYIIEHDFLEPLLKQEIVAHSFERDDLPKWVSKQKGIYGFPSDGRFIDIGTPEDFARAEEVINNIT